MEIEYDHRKGAINMAKHGLPLSLAKGLEWDSLWAKEDTRRDYGDMRMIGYATIDMRLYCVIYTDRKTTRRIISIRKANNREKREYALNN